MIERICLIGLGEVGCVLADDLSKVGVSLSAWDNQFADPGSKPSQAVKARTIREGRDSAEAVHDADLVISAVTAEQTTEAAEEAAKGLRKGTFYLDLNSASPGAKIAAAKAINAAGGHYVEASVMSPIGPKRIGSPILLGGPDAATLQPLIASLGFSGAKVFSAEMGQASAAKLCRSVMVKGIEALLTESMLAARHYGVEETVINSLDDLFPGPDWQELSHYMIMRAVQHGKRRAEEMREAAKTVAQAGIEPRMSAACAQTQDWARQFPGALKHDTLAPMLDDIRASIDANLRS